MTSFRSRNYILLIHVSISIGYTQPMFLHWPNYFDRQFNPHLVSHPPLISSQLVRVYRKILESVPVQVASSADSQPKLACEQTIIRNLLVGSSPSGTRPRISRKPLVFSSPRRLMKRKTEPPRPSVSENGALTCRQQFQRLIFYFKT